MPSSSTRSTVKVRSGGSPAPHPAPWPARPGSTRGRSRPGSDRPQAHGPRADRLGRSECGGSGTACPHSRPRGPSPRRRRRPCDRSAPPRYPETPTARAPAPRRHARNIRSGALGEPSLHRQRPRDQWRDRGASLLAPDPADVLDAMHGHPPVVTPRQPRRGMSLRPHGANVGWNRLPNLGRFLTMQQRGQLLDPVLDPFHDGMTSLAHPFCGI